jgi:hypothetical protein
MDERASDRFCDMLQGVSLRLSFDERAVESSFQNGGIVASEVFVNAELFSFGSDDECDKLSWVPEASK